ncbi:MAG TPA: hypothetical protein VFA20_17810 [Myxococcaceae bacterium]|nr:hypothetical protein [Myxococcaceae bacterium]
MGGGRGMQNGVRWVIVSGAIAGLALWSAAGCGEPPGTPEPTQTEVSKTDGGKPEDGGGGHPDSGSDARSDAGMDGGTDAGRDGGTVIVVPGADGWTFYGPESGAPAEVWSVSSDAAGNLWVAGGMEGLFLMRPGSGHFEHFTVADGLTAYVDETGPHQQSVVSVAGGPAGVVYAGYLGHFGGQEDLDPPYMRKSGDADRVTLGAGGISVQHIDISSPPDPSNPDLVNGRDKIRTVWRELYDPRTGNVWFGGNHGVALWEAQTGLVFEHQHAAINACYPDGHCTLLSGDWFGIALDAAGDLWMGGGHRLAKLKYTNPQRFWGPVAPIIDVWPDASNANRTDDYVQDLAVSGSTLFVGSIPNGLVAIDDSGVHPVGLSGYQSKITSLEADPAGGSLWVGLQYGGMLRISGGSIAAYSNPVFGNQLIDRQVWDIQSDHQGPGGARRLLVAFRAGAVGIYSGP